jgi:septation ring formation regulator EzrA
VGLTQGQHSVWRGRFGAAPARERVRGLEKLAQRLGGELEWLKERIKEQAVLSGLRRNMEAHHRDIRDAERRRADLLARLAQLRCNDCGASCRTPRTSRSTPTITASASTVSPSPAPPLGPAGDLR